ncbi:MAG: SDR family oxidoreductase [Acidobacteriota bacterium]|nr:MAG: SDR family oxidoreductase [Acidobacteriota bacterium]
MTEDRSERVVITGAGRGLGLEFTRQYLAAGAGVFALARHPDASTGLQALLTAHPDRLRTAEADVTDGPLIAAAHDAVRSQWEGIDVLINNAGTYGPHEATLQSLDLGEVRDVLEINTYGPIRVTTALLDLVRLGTHPRVVNITSLMGSIGDNTSGGSWAYRISKAALNMVTRNMAHELTPLGIAVIALHPGWVRTDMGSHRAPLEAPESVREMISTISQLTLEQGGRFLDRTGHPLPW